MPLRVWSVSRGYCSAVGPSSMRFRECADQVTACSSAGVIGLELRDGVVGISGDKLADHHFLFAHEWMMLAMGKEFDERLLEQGSLAFAKGVDRCPGGDYGRFQFPRAAAQHEGAAEPGLRRRSGIMSWAARINFSTCPGRIFNFQTLAYMSTSKRARAKDGLTDATFRASRGNSRNSLRDSVNSGPQSPASVRKYGGWTGTDPGTSEFQMQFPL